MQAAEFWDNSAEKYARSPIRDEDVYRQKLKASQDCFTPESMLFEFGCGTGSTAIEHAGHVRSIVATDISARMLDIARDRAQEAGCDNIRFEQGTIADYAAAGERFDAVLGLNILHLLEQPQAAIDNAYSMLRPGGVFISSTVCLAGRLSTWRLLIPVMQLLGKAPHVTYLGGDQLLNMITGAGFEIELHWPPRKGQAAFVIARKPGA